MTRERTRRVQWTPALDAFMREHYPHRPTRDVAHMLGLRERQIYNRAEQLGLRKSSAYMAQEREIGSTRISSGNVERKVSDDPNVYPARRWVPVHRLVWEAEHGPVPEGRVVVFRTGMHTTDPDRITTDRLELVDRAELMRRNGIHAHGPEIARLHQLRGAITRKVRNRQREIGDDTNDRKEHSA